MLKNKKIKVALVFACLITIIMPYTSTVLAGTLTQTDTTAMMQIYEMRQGGEESGGILTEQQKALYDTKSYGYTVGTTKVYKIVTEGDTEYTNVLYCLEATKSFPGVKSEEQSLQFHNVGEFKDTTDLDVRNLHLSTSITEDSDKWNNNHKSILWLLENMYLKQYDSSKKETFLKNAFQDYSEYDFDLIKTYLTDDDIDVVQQYAIWYFTNNDDEENRFNSKNLKNVTLRDITSEDKTGSYLDIVGSPIRQNLADHLFNYLVTTAEKIGASSDPILSADTYPSFADIEAKASSNDEYYISGPFKINSGTVSEEDYKISVLDENNTEMSSDNYKILVSGESEFSESNFNNLLDKEFYIYLPKSNTDTSKVILSISYESVETKASVWKTEKDIYQPVLFITREKIPHNLKKEVAFEKSVADLSLRKSIISRNGENLEGTLPNIDVSKLKDGTNTTAEYNGAKTPQKVAPNDRVVFQITVYNEGNIEAKGITIADALPTGLEYVEDSEINRTYGWTKEVEENENGTTNRTVYKTDYLKETVIDGFDKEKDNELDSKYVQMECKVNENINTAVTLTNVAEIDRSTRRI